MKRFDLNRLRCDLTAMLPSWHVEHLTAKDCDKAGRPFDPPCAYLRIYNRWTCAELCADGEFYGGEDYFRKLDPAEFKRTGDVARLIVVALRGEERPL